MSLNWQFLKWMSVFIVGAIFVVSTENLSGRVTDAAGPSVYAALKTLRSPDASHGFAVDNTGPGGRTYTKPTNIGLDLLSTLAAVERGQEDPFLAREHVRTVAAGLAKLRTYKGLFPEYIKLAADGAFADTDNGRMRVSSIDSAWLHFALSVAEAYYKKTDPLLARKLGDMGRAADYTVFVREGNTRFRHGMTLSSEDDTVLEEWPFNYDNKNSEARLLVVFLTAIGKVPETVWREMTYTYTQAAGLPVAEGWAMSAFVELAANSYFDEGRLASRTLGRSHANYVAASQRIAAERGYKVFGWAPCYSPEDQYKEYGLQNPDVATPYAAALLTTVDAPGASQNFYKLVQSLSSPAGPAPFPDAVDPRTGQVLNRRALSLDQNLLYHALAKDTLRDLVSRTEWAREASRLISRVDEWHRPLPN